VFHPMAQLGGYSIRNNKQADATSFGAVCLMIRLRTSFILVR
jgi:hypothetical protein